MSDNTPVAVEPIEAPAPTPAAPADAPSWLPERLERAERSAEKRLLGSLGFDSVETAKTLLEEAAKLKAERMTEAERARADAEASAAKAAELEKALAARDLADSKRDVLAKAKLDPSLAEILRGDTPDEFAESVKAYLAANPATPTPLPGPTDAAPQEDPMIAAFARGAGLT